MDGKVNFVLDFLTSFSKGTLIFIAIALIVLISILVYIMYMEKL